MLAIWRPVRGAAIASNHAAKRPSKLEFRYLIIVMRSSLALSQYGSLLLLKSRRPTPKR